MHFRFRGNSVQIVRSQTDSATGKAKSIPIGTINRDNLKISDKLKANCSPTELNEIESWVTRYQAVDELKRAHAAATLAEQMALAAEWFANANPEEARQLTDDVLQTWGSLRGILMRRELP